MARSSIGAAAMALLLLGNATAGAQTPGGQSSDYDTRYGYSTHYGIVTPRDVFALASNFNAILDYYFETHKSDRADTARTLAPEVFSDKQPEDLLVRSQHLADLVDRLGVESHLPPVLRIEPAGETTLPAEPYLQIGASLDGLIFYLSALDASQIWGDYYVTLRYPDEKTPDDAYAVIDLAVRKLELATGEARPAQPAAAPGAPSADAPVIEPQTAAGA